MYADLVLFVQALVFLDTMSPLVWIITRLPAVNRFHTGSIFCITHSHSMQEQMHG